jgi:hypothetical protein
VTLTRHARLFFPFRENRSPAAYADGEGDADGDGEAFAGGEASAPELFLLVLFLPVVFFVVVDSAELLPWPFFAAFCELLLEVVVLVALFVPHEARNATPSRQMIDVRMEFFIGLD